MASTNNFDRDELQKWFEGWWKCYYCGQNTWDCFHHAVGRGNKSDDAESSILNAVPLCNQKCHLPNHGALRSSKAFKKKFLTRTYDLLIERGYKFNEVDKRFLKKYEEFYL